MKYKNDINRVQSGMNYFYCYCIEESTNHKLITHLWIITKSNAFRNVDEIANTIVVRSANLELGNPSNHVIIRWS